jgi:hypothetical protein
MRRALPFALLLAACTRPAAPSPEYAEARRRHAEILAAHPADAAAQPEVGAVLDLLARVPADSADAAAAAELRARLEAERKALAEEAARRESLAADAARPEPMPPGGGEGEGAVAASPPAQRQDALGLARGTRLEDFRARAGDCFEKRTDLEIVSDDEVRMGEAWALKAGGGCAERHPAYAGQYVLFADGAYVSTAPQSAARQVTREPGQRSPGAGQAPAALPAPAPAPAPGAAPAPAPTGAPR